MDHLINQLYQIVIINIEMENPAQNSQQPIQTYAYKNNYEEPHMQCTSQSKAKKTTKQLEQQVVYSQIEPSLPLKNKQNSPQRQATLQISLPQAVSKLCTSKYFNFSLLFFLMLFLISCVIQDRKWNADISKVGAVLQLVCHLGFIFFFVCRTINYKNQNIIWNCIDFLTIAFGIASYFISDYEISRYFKAVRTLKLLFLIKEIQVFNKPASDLIRALRKIGNILLPALIIIYVYAAVGLYVFVDLEYNKCRSETNLDRSSNWTVYNEQIFLCGQMQCPIFEGEQLICLNPVDYDVRGNDAEVVNMVQGNGLMRYSNILFALLSTFKQTFVTGSSRLIMLYKQVLNPIFIQVYFYSYIYLISYIYLNIFYSLIITSEWNDQQSKSKPEDSMPKAIQILQNFKIQNVSEYQYSRNEADFVKETEQNKQNNKCKRVINLKVKNSELDLTKSVKYFRQQTSMMQSNGCLFMNKISNIFQNASQTPVLLTKNELQDPTNDNIQNISLILEYPEILKKYEFVNNIIIVLTCINLSLDFHEQNKDFKFIVDCIDFAFYCVLVIQIVIIVLIQRYSLRKIQFFTKLQIIIALICTIGVVYEACTATSFNDFFRDDEWLSGFFRSFKYLRIMILILRTTFFKEARLILQSTFRSLYIIKYFVGVWLIIVITFGVIGFNLHGYKTKVNKQGLLDMSNGKGFQVSYDGVFQSIIFTMLTFYNEQWDYIMFQQYLGGGALLVIWQLISICVGLLLFSKYFMALLMKQLDNLIDDSLNNEDESQISQIHEQTSQKLLKLDQIQNSNKIRPLQSVNKKYIKSSFTSQDSVRMRKKQSKFNEVQNSVGKEKQHIIDKIIYFLKKCIEHKIYKISFIIFILSSCVVLIMTHPHVNRNSTSAVPYLLVDKINKGFFIFDLVLNVTINGLFQKQNSYLRLSWLNWLNIVIIVFEIMSFTSLNANPIFQKIEKIKVLRTLFMVELKYKLDWSMKITCKSFFQLLPKVLTLLAIMFIMYSYFGLILVKAYKNDFYICQNYPSSTNIENKSDCLNWGGDWVQLANNTANLFNSTLYLFFIATMEGWISLLYPMMNLSGINKQPVLDHNKYISIFVVFFFFFGNLIMLNVFIGLSVSNFKRLKDKTTGQSKLSKKQLQWLTVKTQIHKLAPLILQKQPQNFIRSCAFKVVNHYSYKIVQGVFFCAYLIATSLFRTNISHEQNETLKDIQLFFVSILICEYILQLLSYGIRVRNRKRFIFKNIVVIYAIIFVTIEQVMSIGKYEARIFGGIFIALQFIRYLSLLDDIPIAKKLLNTIVTVLPQTTNILLMICLTLFIYTIFGMQFFSFLKFGSELDSFNQNYTNFSTALFALIKFSTMESPIQHINDAAQQLGPTFFCNSISTYEEFLKFGQTGCGNKIIAYIFFLSFHIFYSLLLMSTVMAIIVDSYSQVKREQQAPVTKLVLEKVRVAWTEIDPQATGYIPYRQFWMFTAKLLQIYMGKQKATDSISALFASRQQFMKKMEIPIYENQEGVLCFQFHQVIQALTRIYMTNNFGTQATKKVQQMFKERQQAADIRFKKSVYTSSHIATLILLKSGLRMWNKKVNNENGKMGYKNFISKFAKERSKM